MTSLKNAREDMGFLSLIGMSSRLSFQSNLERSLDVILLVADALVVLQKKKIVGLARYAIFMSN